MAVRETTPAGDAHWWLHAGDAYCCHEEIGPEPFRPHPLMKVLAEVAEVQRDLRLANLARLRELVRFHGDDVTVFCSHDPWEFDDAVRAAGADRLTAWPASREALV